MLKLKYALLLIFLTACGTNYDAFATCLTDSDAVMYGTEWCSHCNDQKALFGKSFIFVSFVDCDISPRACERAGIEGYPTWIISNESFSGTQSLGKLASLTGCELTR